MQLELEKKLENGEPVDEAAQKADPGSLGEIARFDRNFSDPQTVNDALSDDLGIKDEIIRVKLEFDRFQVFSGISPQLSLIHI